MPAKSKKTKYARFRFFDSDIRQVGKAYFATKAARDSILRQDGTRGFVYQEVGPYLNRALDELAKASKWLNDLSGRPGRGP